MPDISSRHCLWNALLQPGSNSTDNRGGYNCNGFKPLLVQIFPEHVPLPLFSHHTYLVIAYTHTHTHTHLNPAVKFVTLNPQHVTMYGSTSEELVLPVNLERSSDGTSIAVVVLDYWPTNRETHGWICLTLVSSRKCLWNALLQPGSNTSNDRELIIRSCVQTPAGPDIFRTCISLSVFSHHIYIASHLKIP